MQTITLCTSAVFSTTTMSSPCRPPMPNSAQARVASASSFCLNSGSVHALATTLAPSWGPTSFSYISTSRSTAAVVMMPFSIRIDSSALTRAAISSWVRTCSLMLLLRSW